MKKLLYLSCLLVMNYGTIAQNTPSEAKDFLPNVVLPSPEAYQFTRYGEIPVGLFTGSMNFPLQLFSISSGKLSVPVSLNYTSNGVKVDAVAGRTGIDWNLNIGGVITRTIMGQPDDMVNLAVPDGDSSSWTFYNYVVNSVVGHGNTQPDEYSYNFLGYSGKFYFDYQGNIKELSPSGNKITYDQYNFEIITQDGIKYYFTHFENSYSRSLFSDGEPFGAYPGGRTGWYLTKIKNLHGDSIVYNYQLINSPQEKVTYLSGISQTHRSVSGDGIPWLYAHYFKAPNCAPFGTIEYVNYRPNVEAVGTNTDIRVSSLDVAKLVDISFKGGKVKLFYSSREDLPGEEKVDSLQLVSTTSNTVIKTIGLEYVYSQSTGYMVPKHHLPPNMDTLQNEYPYLKKRLFLQKVKIYNENKSSHQVYKFDYEDINGLPPRLSFAQDYFGYFNGKDNISLLPNNTIFRNRLSVSSIASSRAVDSVYNKKGVLKKITYPTGGYSEIDYESNYLSKNGRYMEILDTITLVLDNNSTNYSIYSDTFKLRDYAYLIKLSAEWKTPPVYDEITPLEDSTVEFKLYNQSNESVFIGNHSVWPGGNNDIYDPLYLLNKVDTYRLFLNGGNNNVRAKAQFISFRQILDTVNNAPTSGLRVASIKSFTAENHPAGKKTFDYSAPGGNSSGNAIMFFYDGADFSYLERSLVGDLIKGNYVMSSTNIFGNYTNDYGNINYEYVTERFDSVGSNGKVVTKFQLGSNSIPTTFGCYPGDYVMDYSPFLIPGAPASNTGFMAGKELEKIWYKENGGLLKKVQEVKNYYSVDPRNYNVDSFYMIRRAIQRSEYNNSWKYFNDFDINEYKRISAWVHLDSTIQKEYDDFDNVLNSTTVFTYGNESHMQPTEVVTRTSDGKLSKKITFFPHDIFQSNINNHAAGGMVSNNITTLPMSTLLYSNSTLLRTVTIDYSSDGLPLILKTANGSNSLELEAEYTSYNANGNPQEYMFRNQPNAILTDTSSGNIIAVAKNSVFNDVAFTSFETNFNGNWSGIVAQYIISGASNVTGKKYYYQTNFSLSKSNLSSGKTYEISYWSRSSTSYSTNGTAASGYPKQLKTIFNNGQSWYLHVHRVSNVSSLTLSGSGYLDEVRLHPYDAEMTTYVHIPFVGLSSQTAPDNRSVYYFYDNFNRLSHIKDNDGNVVKKFCYNYQGQPETCGMGTAAIWVATGTSRCKACTANSNYSSNIVEHQEIDNNHNSSTFNAVRWVEGGASSSCVPPADWQTISTTCEKDNNDNNTGNVVVVKKDMNPCSATYNQTTSTSIEDQTSCPVPQTCNSSNCSGQDKKCVNGECETGVKVYTACEYNPNSGLYDCTYHYEFSDNSWSSNYYESLPYEVPVF